MVTRLTGLSGSGIDIDDTVAKLMKAARMPQTKLKQQKQTLDWQRDDYRTINSKIMAFRDLAFNMKLQSSYLAKKATSADESSVTVTGTSTAAAGNYTLKVDQLATAATVTSATKLGATDGASTKLSDLTKGDFANKTTLMISGGKGNASIEVQPADTIGSLVSAINSKSSTTGVNVSYDATMDQLFFTSTSTGEAGKINLSAQNVTGNPNLLDILKIPMDSTKSSVDRSILTGTNNFVGSMAIDSSLKSAQTLKVTINGKNENFTIDSKTTFDKLISDINNSSTFSGVTAYLDNNNNLAFKDGASTPITDFKLSDEKNNQSNVPKSLVTAAPKLAVPLTTVIDSSLKTPQVVRVKVGSTTVDINIDKTTTIGNVIDTVNNSALGKLGVSAYLDGNNRLVFSAPDDSSKPITITDDKGNPSSLPQFQFKSAVTASFAQAKEEIGEKAHVKFNGQDAYYDTNSFTVNGMNFTVKKKTADDVAINVIGDTDAVYNSIKTFIDKYNELIDAINSKVTEKQYRDYQPLTDDQRKDMKDDQIAAWEAKAKSGMLYHDQILTQSLLSFRTAFSSPVTGLSSGGVKSLADIGISTSVVIGGSVSGSYLDNGKIYLDDDKLKKAIAENPDQVMSLFTSDSKAKDANSSNGVATRLNNLATSLISSITSKAGATASVETSYTIGKNTKDLNNRIDAWDTKLSALETRYYNQFSAMEKYINQMYSQNSQLLSQFGQ